MKKIILLLLLTFPLISFGQNDLLQELEKNSKKDTDYTIATFKGTRLVNGHTIETKSGGTLEFIFAHRFGPVNGGLYEMYGLDEAYVRLGLDYGITDDLSVSIGRNSASKIMDGYLKYRVFKQQKGQRNFPISVTALGGMAYSISPKRGDEPAGFETVDRLAYTGQLLIARKITTALSLQLMPTYVHKNAVNKASENNNQFALGIGGRLKITRSMALTTEYYHNFDKGRYNTVTDGVATTAPYYNSIGFGVDIETGGHVFQLVITNGYGLTERAFITETQEDFFDGNIHLGFNVTRTFQLKNNK